MPNQLPLFFERTDAGDASRQRLLLFSYHFPPDRAVGAKRWEKLALFFAERGWALDVIMRADSSYRTDDPRLAQLPPGTRVFALPERELPVERLERAAWRGIRTLRVMRHRTGRGAPDDLGLDGGGTAPATTRDSTFARADVRWGVSPRDLMRAFWAWRDFARVSEWSRRGAALAQRIVTPAVHRAVATSGPPFMVHVAGRLVSEATGLPFVMDMRDPWSHVERLPESLASPAWIALARRAERRAVERATLVVANTEVARRQLAMSYPERADDIVTVMNGSDDEPIPPPCYGDRFTVAHAGTIYLDRDPRALFQAAAEVIREMGLSPGEFALRFMGHVELVGRFPVEAVARELEIEAFVEMSPPGSHREALAFMAQSPMLLTMSGSNMAAIPAKTFECAQFPAWVLALSEPGSATALLLEDTGADVVAPRDAAGIARVLRARLGEFRRGGRPRGIVEPGRFSRGTQATILLDALESRLRAPGVLRARNRGTTAHLRARSASMA